MNNIETQAQRKVQPSRIIFSAIFFLVPIILVCLYADAIFYLTEKSDNYNGYRFLWCVSCSMWGFSVIAFHWRYVTVSIFPEYFLYYPFMLLCISTLVFALLHIVEATSGYLFYYSSFALCFILSLLVDQFHLLFLAVLKKATDKLS
jgi:hypothetical protein